MTEPTPADAFAALLARSGDDVVVLVDEALRIAAAGPEAGRLAERHPEELRGMSLIAAFGSAPARSRAARPTSATSGRGASRSRPCRCAAASCSRSTT